MQSFEDKFRLKDGLEAFRSIFPDRLEASDGQTDVNVPLIDIYGRQLRAGDYVRVIWGVARTRDGGWREKTRIEKIVVRDAGTPDARWSFESCANRARDFEMELININAVG